ncbi:hypothetical protein FRACYDRAFT_254524 [Fragilariopsis cylindrus CCMP1102]|uniref:Uncharacterized protein n=1 Tax=Fragilariopsis cylindrus CCMP1102 TaxID=635003 RepID=A0A1E7EKU2_9STRA|nr:hypothetical protein FRACYDRAFT_254524 [Fragilariopsis cylindrus CCMP1102]|eukprot:OEU06504.1 hypothetical protein FRACYDRAFT_254524 [Fragilariopsis cylindrus CCMP1102]
MLSLILQVFLLSSVSMCAVAFAPTMTPSAPSSGPSSLSRTTSNDDKSSSSRLRVSNTFSPSDDVDYVRNLEDKLIHFSKILDDDVRRNDFEAFVTNKLQEEIAITNAATTAALSSTVERLKLKSLNFVQAMDKSILKLGQSAQDQGWDNHVTSGFQPVQPESNSIWPYVDMLIQFKLLISNMERTTNRKSKNNALQLAAANASTDINTATDASATTTGNGCKCKGCPGLNSCKNGKKRKKCLE